MNATETISLLLLCGVGGYIAEPLCFSRDGASPHDSEKLSSAQITEPVKKYLNLAIACALIFDRGNIRAKMAYENVDPFERYVVFLEGR